MQHDHVLKKLNFDLLRGEGGCRQNILKAKSNLTLLLYIPFLVIGKLYFKCVLLISKLNQLFIWQLNFMFLLS